MKRYSLIQARGADSCGCMDGSLVESEGNDVVEMKIKSGTVSIIVPATLPDDAVGESDWLNNHVCLSIELEDGKSITGWVRCDEAHLELDTTRRVATPTWVGKKDFVRHTLFSKLGALRQDATLVSP
ncbi:MAG: hypothetical protein HY868_04665 [Chloroflexi bacterium]|nr:hypothetical protein [Chloroflexota bacterium]